MSAVSDVVLKLLVVWVGGRKCKNLYKLKIKCSLKQKKIPPLTDRNANQEQFLIRNCFVHSIHFIVSWKD